MLNSRPSIVIHKFLDLRLFPSFCRFCYSEFDYFIKISHNRWSNSWVFGMHCIVINWVKLMEVEHLFIPFCCWFHLKCWLISSHVIDFLKIWLFNDVIERFCEWWNLKSRKEGPRIIDVLDERMPCISIGLNCGDNDRAVFILNFSRRHDRLCSSWNCSWISLFTVFYWKSNISCTITVSLQVVSKLFISWI